MAVAEKRHFLGNVDGKEYYLDLVKTIENDKGEVVPNPSYQKLVWRVPDIREAVEAPKGHLILSADYSQIEVKLMAHLSRDPVLIAAINSGKDIHTFNATEVFGQKKKFDYETMAAAKEDKNHPRYAELVKLRNDVKTVTFGVPYGAGASKVQLMTGMKTLEEAQEFIDDFFNKFKVLKDWLIQSGDDAVKYGFSCSPRGRRRFYERPSSEAKEEDRKKIISQIKRYAGNHPIQAGNVDMLKPAMAMVYKDLRTAGYDEEVVRILFCVHDELVMIAREDLALRHNEQGMIIPVSEMGSYKKAKKVMLPGPIELIMKTRMQESYDGIIPDIVNKIDVAIGPIWDKA